MKPDPAPRPGASRGRIGRTFTRAGLEGRQGLEPGAHRQGFDVHQVEPDPAGSAGPSPAWAWKVTRALSPAPWVEPDGCRRPSAGASRCTRWSRTRRQGQGQGRQAPARVRCRPNPRSSPRVQRPRPSARPPVARALSPAPWVEPDGCRRPSAGLRGAPGGAGRLPWYLAHS